MMDLHSRMERLAGTIEDTPTAVIEDDLARGRRAVRRRRTAQVTGGSAFGVAAVAAAFSLTAQIGGAPAGSPPVVAHSAPGATTVTTAGIQLVSYTGKQPHLFTIDTVPQGFFIQSQDDIQLLLAPQAAKVPDPANPDLADPRVYTDKIAVFLQDREYTDDPDGDEQFTIGGKPAALRSRAGFTQIYVVQAPKVNLTVQFDNTTGLTKEQMIKVAEGINVTPEAIAKEEALYQARKDNPKIHDN
jgi:hypothetical protein